MGRLAKPLGPPSVCALDCDGCHGLPRVLPRRLPVLGRLRSPLLVTHLPARMMHHCVIRNNMSQRLRIHHSQHPSGHPDPSPLLPEPAPGWLRIPILARTLGRVMAAWCARGGVCSRVTRFSPPPPTPAWGRPVGCEGRGVLHVPPSAPHGSGCRGRGAGGAAETAQLPQAPPNVPVSSAARLRHLLSPFLMNRCRGEEGRTRVNVVGLKKESGLCPRVFYGQDGS